MVRPLEDCATDSTWLTNYADSHTSQRIQDGGPACEVLGPCQDAERCGEFCCISLGNLTWLRWKKEVFNLNLLYQSNHILTAIHSHLSPVDRYKRRKDMQVSRAEAKTSTSICQRYVNILTPFLLLNRLLKTHFLLHRKHVVLITNTNLLMLFIETVTDLLY
jgi:hypothetical protein